MARRLHLPDLDVGLPRTTSVRIRRKRTSLREHPPLFMTESLRIAGRPVPHPHRELQSPRGALRRYVFRVAMAFILVAAAAAIPEAAAWAQGVEIVRGRVLRADGQPVENASITITGLQTRAVRTTTTDARGSYTALFSSSEGAYSVSVRALGFAPQVTEVERDGDSNIILADFRMSSAPPVLDPVTVTETRRPQVRDDGLSVGAASHDLRSGALFSLDPADLNELAMNVPGVMAAIGADGDSLGFSVLGASPDQNNTVVDGSSFSGSALPPDAVGSARLITSTFDPSRGQFAGGQISVSSRGGTDIFTGTIRGNRADRRLSWADPASPITVPTNDQFSGSIGGPIRKQKSHYFAAFEIRRNTRDAMSLLEISDELLNQRGLSRDTIRSVQSALHSIGVPTTASNIPESNTDNRQSLFTRFDFAPSATTSLTLRADGSWAQQGGGGTQQYGFPTLGGSRTNQRLGLQASGSIYKRGILTELRTSLQQTESDSRPYLEIPGGSVRVGVRQEDGREGLTSLRFGGATGSSRYSQSLQWETTAELSWISLDSKHQLKFGQSFSLVRDRTEQPGDQFGTFSYQSLDDLANNQPASYSRTFSARQRRTSGVTGALWVGDEWRVRRNLRFQLGTRVDATRPATTPQYNPLVDSLFGLRTDKVPSTVAVSPRVGFAWSPWGSTAAPQPAMGPMGVGIRAGGGMGGPGFGRTRQAMVPQVDWKRFVSVSGGIGAFRGTIPNSRIASLVDASGMANTTRRLTCVGDATPLPEWDDVSWSVPDSCVDGTAPEEFSTRQPSVMALDPDFNAPVSWRGNLGIQGLRVRGFGLGLQVTHSIGMDGESRIDMNMQRTPRFALSNEAGRPVYAAPDLIVPATGVIAPGAGRVDDRFSSVTRLVSDLRSEATQFQVSLNPMRPLFGRMPLNFSYTWTTQRAHERGFGGNTAGNPFEREWASGSQPSHQLMASTSTRVWWLALSLRLNFMSGTRYTPMVAGDVNGDGSSNDRAFIYDPATVTDGEFASQMNAVLQGAPERARKCLLAQVGRIAGRNSCETGWQTRMDMNVNFSPPRDIGFGDRLRASITLVNATGAIFRLTGLDDSPLARAASPMRPDPTLLYVTGFDTVSQQFRYRVNQRFGDQPDRGRNGRHLTQPFQVRLGLEYNFGGPPRNAMVRNLGLTRGRSQPQLTAAQVKERLRQLSQSPIAPLLAMSDSLGLSDTQRDSLRALDARLTTDTDSLLAPLTSYLVERGDRVTDAELGRQLMTVMRPVQVRMASALEAALAVLTEDQRNALPPFYSNMLRRRAMPGPGGRPGPP
jgi:hypothetical protein